jgi:hypothetical protein
MTKAICFFDIQARTVWRARPLLEIRRGSSVSRAYAGGHARGHTTAWRPMRPLVVTLFIWGSISQLGPLLEGFQLPPDLFPSPEVL